jgi:hypothetical protein
VGAPGTPLPPYLQTRFLPKPGFLSRQLSRRRIIVSDTGIGIDPLHRPDLRQSSTRRATSNPFSGKTKYKARSGLGSRRCASSKPTTAAWRASANTTKPPAPASQFHVLLHSQAKRSSMAERNMFRLESAAFFAPNLSTLEVAILRIDMTRSNHHYCSCLFWQQSPSRSPSTGSSSDRRIRFRQIHPGVRYPVQGGPAPVH